MVRPVGRWGCDRGLAGCLTLGRKHPVVFAGGEDRARRVEGLLVVVVAGRGQVAAGIARIVFSART
jgi:hypothetical protein